MTSELRDVSDWLAKGFFEDAGLFSGTSNTDGFGCGALLKEGEEETSLYLEETVGVGGKSISSPDGTVDMAYGTDVTIPDYDVTLINDGFWNARGYKEATVVSDTATDILVDNYVDACILALAEDNFGFGVDINIVDAKRGLIVTGDGSDTIDISAKSNNATWSTSAWNNSFVIDTGDGADSITLTHSKNSHSTEYNIMAGDGWDIVDVSGLHAMENIANVTMADGSEYIPRSVDGGEGFDVLVVSDTENIVMSNLEVIKGQDNGQSLALTDELLENNGQSFSIAYNYEYEWPLELTWDTFEGSILFVDGLALSNDSSYSAKSMNLGEEFEAAVNTSLALLGITDEFDLDADIYMTQFTNGSEEYYVISDSDMAVA